MCESKERPIGYYLKSSDHAMKSLIQAKIKDLEIDEVTSIHGYILQYIVNSEKMGKDIYQKDLEAHMEVGKSSITAVLNVMEKNGYIERKFVKHDARLKKIIATEKGKEVSTVLTEVIKESEKLVLAEFSEEEKTMLYSLLERVRNRAESLEADIKTERKGNDAK